jgi:hypothetical protein
MVAPMYHPERGGSAGPLRADTPEMGQSDWNPITADAMNDLRRIKNLLRETAPRPEGSTARPYNVPS